MLPKQVRQISLLAGQQSHKRWLCRAKSDKVEQLKQENEALQADIHKADLEIEELSQNLQVRQRLYFPGLGCWHIYYITSDRSATLVSKLSLMSLKSSRRTYCMWTGLPESKCQSF